MWLFILGEVGGGGVVNKGGILQPKMKEQTKNLKWGAITQKKNSWSHSGININTGISVCRMTP